MNNLACKIIYPQPRKLTFGLVLALSLFSLTVNAQTVVRYNSNGEITASGDDIGAVQRATGAAEGDVIKVSDGAAFNTSVTKPINNFTIESATGNVVNVPVQAEYHIPQIPAAPVCATFKNISFTSSDSYTSSFWRGDWNQDNIIGITIDGKVSFSNFKDSVFEYYLPIMTTDRYPYKFTCTSGSSLTFSGNKTSDKGAAIARLSELNGNSSFMTFSGNEATRGGAIYILLGDSVGTTGLIGNNNQLTFSNNKANGTSDDDGGGAIWSLGSLYGSDNTLTFTGNTAEGNGGAIDSLGYLEGSGNTLEFSGNSAERRGGAIRGYRDLIGEKNQLTFSNNKANGTGPDAGGGAIWNLTNLSGSGNTLEFSENTAAKSGGAIYQLGLYWSFETFLVGLNGNNNQLTFSKNTANGTEINDGGGAIWNLTNLSGSGNILEFSDNTAAKSGGAIWRLGNARITASSTGLNGNNNQLTFSKNTANGTDNEDGGGAIYELTSLGGSGNILDFSENTAAKSGGAIYKLGYLGYDRFAFTGNSNKLTFSNNKANGTGNDDGGGAIYLFYGLSGSGNKLEFTGNTANYGGAIYKLAETDDDSSGFSGSGNTLKFSENTAALSGGAIYKLADLSGSGNKLTFSKNTANGTGDTDGGGAIYELTNFSGSGNILEFSENTAAKSGGAIYQLGVYESDGTASGGLTGNNNKLTFSNNKANDINPSDIFNDNYGGGAIYQLALSGSGNTLEFTGNTAKRSGGAILVLTNLTTGSGNTLEFSENTAKRYGGAIWLLSNLGGSGNTLEFSENTAKSGGAIHVLRDLSGSGNTLKFSGNTAGSGGAISSLTNLSGSGNTLTFTGNTAEGSGGAISSLTNLSGEKNTLTFSGNTAEGHGGAIYDLDYLSGSGNTLTFSGNTAETHGGAIGQFWYLSGSNNTLTFTGNKAGDNGGAIANFSSLSGENNELTFTGNTAGNYGGAIFTDTSIVFSGNNTLTFTGNKAGTKGNDIYLKGYTSTLPANLTFSGGTYSFDGGIWLAEINNKYGKTTISNGAKVTIAGRNDDSVNEYEFRDVALNANLTATVDDIEYLHGNFTVGENGLMTIKKGSDTATIKSSSNYGVMDLLINKAEEVETISISSGRIDIKGCIDATIELQNDAEHPTTFSPGNSVGHVDIDGAFILNAGTTLLIEMDATGIDTMAATSFDLDNGTISFTLSDEIPGGASYDILTAKNGTPFDEDIITRMLNGQTLPEYYTLALAGPTNNIVRFSIDRNAVPEPSTWALLILGAAGLMYMRKRSRQ